MTCRQTTGGIAVKGIQNQWGDDVAAFYTRTGIGSRVGFGSTPAIVIVDMQVAFNDPTQPLGADMTNALSAVVTLLEEARAKDVPVIYVWTAYHPDMKDAGMWAAKIPGLKLLQLGTPGVEIHPDIAPMPEDHLVLKKGPSGFFMTNLAGLLRSQEVDTVILAGASTSGCIRATAIDALSNGFRLILPAEAIGDRAEGPHDASLFDINAKYGDVVPLDEALEYLRALEPSEQAGERETVGTPGATV